MKPFNFKQKYFTHTGKLLPLQKQLFQSGEATLWQGPTTDSIAKIYHAPSPEKATKLEAMVGSPPENPTAQQHHTSIAWPESLIYNSDKQVVGFLMPKISRARTLNYVYNPKLRRQFAQGFNWYYLHTACMNLAWILHALHARNYVIGDLKTDNFLVTPQALVSVIDTDSFQTPNHFCPVGSEGFTPAELIDQDLASLARQPHHDSFGLAVIIYLMLFGYHPYSGTWKGDGPMPSRDFLIKEGQWMFAPNSQLEPSVNALPLSILYPRLEQLFHQAFTEGHKDPTARPTPQQWIHALKEALENLEMCPKEVGHFYYRRANNENCPWCEMDKKLGLNLFPTPKNYFQDDFLVQKKFEKAIKDGDDKELLKLWQDPSAKGLLQKDQTKKLKVEQASIHKHFLDSFQRTFKNAPQDDQQLLSLWDKCKTFTRSLFSKEKLAALGGKTPSEVMEGVFRRRKALQTILEACRKKPTDFMQVYEVWKTVEQKSHPIFKEHMATIEEALDLARAYQNLLKAIKKNEPEKINELWDEYHFAAPIKAAGLQEKVQQALDQTIAQNQVFEPLANAIYRSVSFVHAKWDWGKSAAKAQGAFVAISFETLPQLPEDVEEKGQLQLITKETYLDNKGVWLSIPPEQAGHTPSISVWPAKRHCGKFVVCGDPLRLEPHKPRRLYCTPRYTKSRWKEKTLKLFRAHSLTLKLRADTMVRLPETNIVAAFKHPPVTYDQDTLYIGKLPPFTMHANDTKEISLPLPAWFTSDFEVAILPRHKNQPLNVEVYYEVA